jgi:hypothetical protein
MKTKHSPRYPTSVPLVGKRLSKRRALWIAAISAASLTASASAAVTDISGDLGDTLDNVVGPGNTARLIANTKTFWAGGTFNSAVDLNNFTLNIDNGSGNAQTYTGALTGPGILKFSGSPNATFNPDLQLQGGSANTPTSVLITQGRVKLAKTAGVDALAGPITVTTPGTVRIDYVNANQINDLSTIDSTSSSGGFYLMINGVTDTIRGLTIKSDHRIETSSGGVLTTGFLTVGGVPRPPGTYTSSSGFVTGAGSVVVTGIDVEISGLQTDTIDNVVAAGSGTVAKLVDDATTDWHAGTFLAPIQLNTFDLNINTGGGNAQTYNGKIFGPGTLTLTGNATASESFPTDITIGGGYANTISGATIVQGRIHLNKTAGLDALTGPITANVPTGNTAMLIWLANNQINDTSSIDASGGSGTFIVKVGSHQDSFVGLNLRSGDTIDTTGGGLLSLKELIVDGTPVASGTYTNTSPFVTGEGSVIVTVDAADEFSTVEASDDAVPADNIPVTITVTVKDAANNPVAGKSVALVSSRGGSDTISAPSGPSDANGVVTFTVMSEVEGISTYTASVPSDSLTLSDTVDVEYEFFPYFRISNATTPGDPLPSTTGVKIDATVPSNKIGLLIGPTKTHWSTNGFSRTLELNEQTLTIDTGGGNAYTVTGTVTGNGAVILNGGGASRLNLGGATGNTYTGTTTVNLGPIRLQKTSGNVISGSSVLVNGSISRMDLFGSEGVLLWAADNQVADGANFTLQAGSFQLAGFSETVGTATLTGDFTIKLGTATTSKLHFADSSATSWTSGKVLTITEWDGNYAGGGNEGIFFGTTSTGLTGGQLAQISFVNPTGVDPGTYGAKILSTGEVVPNTAPPGYEGWAENYAGNQAADLDFDNDGVPNGVEYFMGEIGSTFTANPGIDEFGAVLWLKDPNFFGTYEVQVSYNLEDWEAAPEEALFHFDNGVELDTTVLTPEDGKVFFRLLVSPGAPE